MKQTPLQRKKPWRPKRKPINQHSKTKRRVDEELSRAFRNWVRHTQVCCWCGAKNPDPSHVRNIGIGGTSYPYERDRENVVPHCRTCHELYERTKGHHSEIKAIAIHVWALWEESNR